MKRMASANANSKSSRGERAIAYAMCIDPANYKMSLTLGKAYQVLKPGRGSPRGWLRIIDDTEEDYYFPSSMFVKVELPAKARRAIATASET